MISFSPLIIFLSNLVSHCNSYIFCFQDDNDFRASTSRINASTISLNNIQELSHFSGSSTRINTSTLTLNTQESTRPVDYIEIFADNLDFSLKLLKDENSLVNNIFYKSDETRVELTSKLTILVIDQIQKEFEKFFTNSCDFSKLSNSDDEVVAAIIKLLLKVHNLKEKTTCLQTEDLSSGSKLLMFSMRLNEISSQIFASYLEAIKKGYFSTFELPYNCSVHEHVIRVCDMWRLISKHEKCLLDPIKLACESKNLSKDKEHNNILGI